MHAVQNGMLPLCMWPGQLPAAQLPVVPWHAVLRCGVADGDGECGCPRQSNMDHRQGCGCADVSPPAMASVQLL